MRRSRPALARSRAVAALAAGALLLPVSACGDEGSSTGGEGGESADAPTSLDDVANVDDFAAYLSTFPGVEEVAAEDQEADTDFYILNADVGVADDATPAQIIAVIEAVQDYGDGGKYGDIPTFSLHPAGEEDHRISLWLYPTLDPTPLVTTFVTAVDSATLDDVGWSVGSEAEIAIDEASLPDAASVTALAEEIAADPALDPIEGWLLPSDQNAVPRAYLMTRIGLTDDVLAAWDALTAEPGDDLTLAAVTLAAQQGFGEGLADPYPDDAFGVSVDITFGDAKPAAVTEAAYGDVLLPLLESHVEAVNALPSDETTYELSQRYDGDDLILATLPLPKDPEWGPAKTSDPAWQQAADQAWTR